MKADLVPPRPNASTRRSVAVLALLAGLAVPATQAATTTASLNVSATVVATCSVSTANVAFGNYSSAQTDASGSVSVTCTNLAPYIVALDAGGGSGANTTTRKMTGPSSQTLNYALYQDATRLLHWGNTSGVDTVAGVGNGAAQTLTVYGRISSGQYSGAGSYSDVVTVTVTY